MKKNIFLMLCVLCISLLLSCNRDDDVCVYVEPYITKTISGGQFRFSGEIVVDGLAYVDPNDIEIITYDIYYDNYTHKKSLHDFLIIPLTGSKVKFEIIGDQLIQLGINPYKVNKISLQCELKRIKQKSNLKEKTQNLIKN